MNVRTAVDRPTATGKASGSKVPPLSISAETTWSPASAIASPLPFGELRPDPFVTHPDSPFKDKYSIDGELAALAEVMASPDAEASPQYPRIVELERRQALMAKATQAYEYRNRAEPAIEDREAHNFSQLGNLVDDEEDSMLVHTLHAHRLYMGRAPSPDGKLYGIPGGRNQASALRVLWLLSADDNPYAEWALLLHEQSQKRLLAQLTQGCDEFKGRIKALAERGMSIKLQVSAQPAKITLNYRSPYSYAVSELILEYDLFVRYAQTMSRKNQISDDKARQRIQEVTRPIRASWIEIARFERYLVAPEMRKLSRSDFLPNADEHARKRAQAASQLFAGIPAQVFDGTLSPEHSRRRARLSDQDRALLRSIGTRLQSGTMAFDAGSTDEANGTGDQTDHGSESVAGPTVSAAA